jgi:phosphatidylinositol 3,5-bisphosphate 5-phosphatase
LCDTVRLQVRGSIPLYWEHELGTRKVKPAIHLQRYDPLYTSTCLHFQDLAARYGSPLLVLNLVKSTEKVARESILQRELDLAIKYYNKKASVSNH